LGLLGEVTITDGKMDRLLFRGSANGREWAFEF